MLVKAVALSLVLGGVGFVANNAQAFSPIEEIQLKSKVDANHVRSMNNQDAITHIKADVATNKANIKTNAKGISDNNIAIQKEAAARKGDIQYVNGMAGLEKQERENNDKKLEQKIEVEAKARKDADAMNSFMAGLEKQERENNDAKLDAKIDKETKNREFGEFKLNTKVNAEGEARVAGDELLNKKIEKETKDREFGEFKLNTKINAEGEARVANDKLLNTKIDAETDARVDADKKLQKQIDKNGIKADTALKVIGNGAMQNGATNLTDGVNQNTRLVEAEAKARDDADKAEAKAREEADTKLQNNIKAEATTRENAVNALNSRIDQVGSDATKGIAKASALAALHPLDYDPDNKFDIAAAGGFYKGENAFALGAFYRPNRNVMLSMGTTLTSGDNAYNVGLTFKIGKSGKHTEAGLTTADLYAMIGAMQDKMDQQQKKIEELEAKQAK